MKFLIFVLGAVAATKGDCGYENAQKYYKCDWNAYKASRPHDNDCSIYESKNWKGA